MSTRTKLLVASFLLLLLSIRTVATGVFISANADTLHIDALQIRAEVDSNTNNITLTYDVSFEGDANYFVWLLPIPTDDVQVTPSPNIPQYIGYRYPDLAYLFPPRLCADFYPPRNYGSGRPYYSRPEVHGYENFSDYDVLYEWLNANSYPLNHTEHKLLQDYFVTGHSVLALPMFQDSEVGGTTSVTISYRSDDLSIWLPLHLTALTTEHATNDRVRRRAIPLQLEIFADTQYAPINIPHPRLNFEQLQMPHSINNHDNHGTFGLWHEAFDTLVNDTLATAPEAFTTLYAGINDTEPAGYSYRTILYTWLSPHKTRTDPIFAPAPNLLDLATVDFTNQDAAQFWRCSTRTLDTRQQQAYRENELPTGRTYVRGQTVPHPEDWVRSDFEIEQRIAPYWDEPFDWAFRVTAFAPESITAETVHAFERGEATLPMILVTTPYQNEREGDRPSLYYLEIDGSRRQTFNRPYFFTYYNSYNAKSLYILASAEEWVTHEAQYQAILDFPLSYVYASHSALLHTLYIQFDQFADDITTRWLWRPFQIGFPDGWIEYYDEVADEFYFLPEDVGDLSQAVRLEMREVPPPPGRVDDLSEAELDAYIDDVMATLGIPPEYGNILRETLFTTCPDDSRIREPMPMRDEDRYGYAVGELGIQLVAGENSPITDEQLAAMAESLFVLGSDSCG